jgi:hypothetical protein
MTTITVICQEQGYPDVLIYAITVENPHDMAEVGAAIYSERQRDLGEGECGDITLLFAFAGDLMPIADWRG